VGVYRLWRDTGYVVGGVLGGVVADALDVRAAVWAMALLSAMSGLVVAVRMASSSPLVRAVVTAPTG
jgi:hypothetical protein